ncbi:MAG: glutamate-1-semialdehyde 2,1-aminomutase [Acidobacteriota bacterium]
METLEATRSRQLLARAEKVIPGGVNSPVRAFKAVGGFPPFIRSAQGSRLWDVDGREFVDYVASWGPMILGHAHPEVVGAIQEAAGRGTSYGAPTEQEVQLAEKISQFFPSIEKVRLVNSGTEATMSAVRLARAYTGRSLIVKFDGCYHGHSDGLLVKAGSGVATLGLPDTPGVPDSFTRQTLTLPFNDVSSLQRVFERYRNAIAAVMVEPVTGNMGVIVPRPGYLETLLRLGEENGTVVIFDEVMTGFRVAAGGAQQRFGLSAPLTCLGKIVGGGLPIGAYGGRNEIMDLIAPVGSVYQAGTLSGNPLAVAAGLKTLEILERDPPYAELEEKTSRLRTGLGQIARRRGIDLQIQSCGSMFTLFFNSQPVVDYASAKQSDTDLFSAFFRGMLERGVYLAPSQFEAGFVSTRHTDSEIEETIQIAEAVFKDLSEG